MALIKRNYVCSHLQHYVEQYVLSCNVYQAAKSRNTSTPRRLRPLPMSTTKWHSVSIDWISGLPPTTRGHDAIKIVVDRFSKRGMFIPCTKDMTADNLIYTTLSARSMCVLLALLLCRVLQRWHGGGGHCNVHAVQKIAQTRVS